MPWGVKVDGQKVVSKYLFRILLVKYYHYMPLWILCKGFLVANFCAKECGPSVNLNGLGEFIEIRIIIVK